MKKASALLPGTLVLAVLCALCIAAAAVGTAQDAPDQEAQPQQIQKPTYDYMSHYLSRSTRPLGLKDNPLVREMLGQKASKWAIRAGARHILD